MIGLRRSISGNYVDLNLPFGRPYFSPQHYGVVGPGFSLLVFYLVYDIILSPPLPLGVSHVSHISVLWCVASARSLTLSTAPNRIAVGTLRRTLTATLVAVPLYVTYFTTLMACQPLGQLLFFLARP